MQWQIGPRLLCGAGADHLSKTRPGHHAQRVRDWWQLVVEVVLGRPNLECVLASDGTGSVTTVYNANFTTVTDQAGKVRRSMVDGLGRVICVDEPDGSNNLGSTTSPVQPTHYTYDVFGNCYDSLSRLRTVFNPESGTTSYQYDDNGNLIVKTDARGVSLHNSYDSINSQSVAGGSIGRLVALTYGSGANGDYFAYDSLGRSTLKYQKMGTANYLISASYSLSGALLSTTYPSGHTVNNSFDQAGRLSGFRGNLGDGTTRTYSTGILYGPTGAMVKEQFGTNTAIYNKLFYNSRGQLAEIRISTSYTGPADFDANRGGIVNHYSSQCLAGSAVQRLPDDHRDRRRYGAG